MRKLTKLTVLSLVGIMLIALLGAGAVASEGFHPGIRHLENLGEPKPIEEINIAFITFSLHVSDYSWYVFDGLRKRMAEYGRPFNMHMSAAGGTGDYEGLNRLVEEAVIRGTDFLVVHPITLMMNTPIIDLAYEHKIPLVWFNVGPSGYLDMEEFPCTSYVGYSHYEGGEMVGHFLADYLNEGDFIGFQRFIPGSYAEFRIDGAQDVLKAKRPDISWIEEFSHSHRSTAYELAIAFLSGFPEMRVIYGASSAVAMGAAAAVETMGEDVGCIGYGCVQEEVEGILEGRLLGSILRDPWDNGKVIGDIIALWWEGRDSEIQPGYTTFQKLIYSPDLVVKYVDPLYWQPWIDKHGMPEYDYVPERDIPEVRAGLHDPEHLKNNTWLTRHFR